MDEQEADATIRKLGDYILEKMYTDPKLVRQRRQELQEIVLMTMIEQQRQKELGEIRSFISAIGSLGMRAWVESGRLKFSKSPEEFSQEMRTALNRIRRPLIDFLTDLDEAKRATDKRLEQEQKRK